VRARPRRRPSRRLRADALPGADHRNTGLRREDPTVAATVLGLLAAAVFAPENTGQPIPDSYWLRLHQQKFPICAWWGRQDDFREILVTARAQSPPLGTVVLPTSGTAGNHFDASCVTRVSLRPLSGLAVLHKSATMLVIVGAPSGFRTPDPLIKSQLLYQLS
jgi:hypothetical protein